MWFVWIWEQRSIISLYSINWLVFITETECVYCVVRTGSLYIMLRSDHSVVMCFVWVWEQTAIISLYSINWLVFVTETECLLRSTEWNFIYNSGYSWVAGLSPRRPGFDLRSVRFVVHKVALGQVFSRYFGFPRSVHPTKTHQWHSSFRPQCSVKGCGATEPAGSQDAQRIYSC